MKPREYCCCAIPIVNTGIYATLTEQFVLGILVGVLSLSTPSIVGAVTPSSAPWILAILSFVVAAIQVIGFIGVAKEKPILYRRYVSLHSLTTVAAFAVAAAWLILSATRHSTAKTNCLNDFFTAGDAAQNAQGDVLCDVIPWVDIGVMGGLLAVFGILQTYLYFILSSYGSSQRRDHEKYDRVQNENIPMNPRNDPWDSRQSTDSLYSPRNRTAHGYDHVRQESGGSVSDMIAQPRVQPQDTLSNRPYDEEPHSPPGDKQYGGLYGGAAARA